MGEICKECTKCLCHKPLSEFHRTKNGDMHGRRAVCKSCRRMHEPYSARKEYYANYRQENRKKISVYMAEYNARRKLSQKAYYAAWRQKNIQMLTAYYGIYYQENKEKIQRRVRSYQRKNPEVGRAAVHRRRKHLNGSFSADEWLAMKKQYRYSCLKCGKSEPDIKLSVDHVVPISRGGQNIIENIQPLCRSCNSKKGVKIIDYRLLDGVDHSEVLPFEPPIVEGAR